MKIALIISYVFIVVLVIVAFLQWKAIKKNTIVSTEGKREVSAGEWTKELSDKLKEMNVELKF